MANRKVFGVRLMYLKTILAIATLSLTACNAVSEQTYGPDGRVAHAINCSDAYGVGMDACWLKAGEICGVRGYDVLNKDTDETATAVVTGWESVFGAASAETNRVLLISCKSF